MFFYEQKNCFITGITGQDGSIAEFLLKKLSSSWNKRRSSSYNTGRIDHIYEEPQIRKIFLRHDLTDSLSLLNIAKD